MRRQLIFSRKKAIMSHSSTSMQWTLECKIPVMENVACNMWSQWCCLALWKIPPQVNGNWHLLSKEKKSNRGIALATANLECWKTQAAIHIWVLGFWIPVRVWEVHCLRKQRNVIDMWTYSKTECKSGAA
jgi:hypothetical protein